MLKKYNEQLYTKNYNKVIYTYRYFIFRPDIPEPLYVVEYQPSQGNYHKNNEGYRHEQHRCPEKHKNNYYYMFSILKILN